MSQMLSSVTRTISAGVGAVGGGNAGDLEANLNLDSGENYQCCKLTYQQRLVGFASCFGVGMLFGFLSFFFIWSIPSDPLPFAAFYSLGNLASIASFFFLMSPRTQLKRMFHKSRWIYATVMLAALLTTIVLAIAAPGGAGGIIILLVIVQWVAMMCYCITYIPFGEQMVKGFWSRLFGGGGGGG